MNTIPAVFNELKAKAFFLMREAENDGTWMSFPEAVLIVLGDYENSEQEDRIVDHLVNSTDYSLMKGE